jgi:putative Mg2+ transporter-C (MgtC) family protein
LPRFLIAALLAGVIGWDRESIGKSAGVCTHMLVGLSAAVFVTLGELFMLHFDRADGTVQFDPIRIIQAVVAGISFLGAGTIFVSRGRDRVHGLTTAASIWASTAVGMLAGIDRHVLAVTCTLLVLVILRALGFLDSDRQNNQRSSHGANTPNGRREQERHENTSS